MIRFYNARILTMQNNLEITRGEVWTDGDRISYCGGEKECADIAFERD